jgi:hypothetical protein
MCCFCVFSSSSALFWYVYNFFSQREPSDAIAIEHCWFEQDEIQGKKVHYRSKPVYYQFLQLVLIYLTNR